MLRRRLCLFALISAASYLSCLQQVEGRSPRVYDVSPRRGETVVSGSRRDELMLEAEVIDFVLGTSGVLCGELDGRDLGCFEEEARIVVTDLPEGEHILVWFLSHFDTPELDTQLEVPFIVVFRMEEPPSSPSMGTGAGGGEDERKEEGEGDSKKEEAVSWKAVLAQLMENEAEVESTARQNEGDNRSDIMKWDEGEVKRRTDEIERKYSLLFATADHLHGTKWMEYCDNPLPYTYMLSRRRNQNFTSAGGSGDGGSNIDEEHVLISLPAIDKSRYVWMLTSALTEFQDGSLREGKTVRIKGVVGGTDDAVVSTLLSLSVVEYAQRSCGAAVREVEVVDKAYVSLLLSQYRRKSVYQTTARAGQPVEIVIHLEQRQVVVELYPHSLSEWTKQVHTAPHWQAGAHLIDLGKYGLRLPSQDSLLPGIKSVIASSKQAVVLSDIHSSEVCAQFEFFSSMAELDKSGLSKNDMLDGCIQLEKEGEEDGLRCVFEAMGFTRFCSVHAVIDALFSTSTSVQQVETMAMPQGGKMVIAWYGQNEEEKGLTEGTAAHLGWGGNAEVVNAPSLLRNFQWSIAMDRVMVVGNEAVAHDGTISIVLCPQLIPALTATGGYGCALAFIDDLSCLSAWAINYLISTSIVQMRRCRVGEELQKRGKVGIEVQNVDSRSIATPLPMLAAKSALASALRMQMADLSQSSTGTTSTAGVLNTSSHIPALVFDALFASSLSQAQNDSDKEVHLLSVLDCFESGICTATVASQHEAVASFSEWVKRGGDAVTIELCKVMNHPSFHEVLFFFSSSEEGQDLLAHSLAFHTCPPVVRRLMSQVVDELKKPLLRVLIEDNMIPPFSLFSLLETYTMGGPVNMMDTDTAIAFVEAVVQACSSVNVPPLLLHRIDEMVRHIVTAHCADTNSGCLTMAETLIGAALELTALPNSAKTVLVGGIVGAVEGLLHSRDVPKPFLCSLDFATSYTEVIAAADNAKSRALDSIAKICTLCSHHDGEMDDSLFQLRDELRDVVEEAFLLGLDRHSQRSVADLLSCLWSVSLPPPS